MQELFSRTLKRLAGWEDKQGQFNMKNHDLFPLAQKNAVSRGSLYFRLEALPVTLNTSMEIPFRNTETYPFDRQWQVCMYF